MVVAGKHATATATATATPLLVKKVTLTAAHFPAKSTPTSPNLLPFLATTTTIAKSPTSSSSRGALPIPSTCTYPASPTATPAASPAAVRRWTHASPRRTTRNDDGATANQSPVASTSTADTLPLAGLVSPAAASRAPSIDNAHHPSATCRTPELARPAGSVERHDARHTASTSATRDELHPPCNQPEGASPAKQARVNLSAPLRLSAVLRSLQSGELSSQQVRRTWTAFPFQTKLVRLDCGPSPTHSPYHCAVYSECVRQVHNVLDLHVVVARPTS